MNKYLGAQHLNSIQIKNINQKIVFASNLAQLIKRVSYRESNKAVIIRYWISLVVGLSSKKNTLHYIVVFLRVQSKKLLTFDINKTSYWMGKMEGKLYW